MAERVLLYPEPPEQRLTAHQVKRIAGFPESRVLGQIENENTTKYSEVMQRLPSMRTIAGKLENMRLLSYAEAVNLLWALGNTYRLIAIPGMDDPGFEEYLLVVAGDALVKEIYEETCESLNKEHMILYSRQTPLKVIRSRHEGKLGADREVTTNREHKFLQILQTYCTMDDFLSLDRPSPERAEGHRLYVFDTLAKHNGGEVSQASTVAPLNIPGVTEEPHRRAADDPEFQEFEKHNPTGTRSGVSSATTSPCACFCVAINSIACWPCCANTAWKFPNASSATTPARSKAIRPSNRMPPKN